MPSFPGGMPSFSVSELKQKAHKAKAASLEKIHDTRDRYSSQSSKNLDLDPNGKRPPPPPPPSKPPTAAANSRAQRELSSPPPAPSPLSRPPVIRKDTRPDQGDTPPPPAYPRPSPPVRSPVPARQEVTSSSINWTNLSVEDKEVFFSWLDEYFARRLNVPIPPRGFQTTVSQPQSTVSGKGPPTLPTWARPTQPSRGPSVGGDISDSFILSYPPATAHGSAALDLAQYFDPSCHWDTSWYTDPNPLPAPLRISSPPTYVASIEVHGTTRTLCASVIFADLSVCWYSVQFSANAQADPNDTRAVVRTAQYLPRPTPMSQEALMDAHETYGETIAGFAESFEGTGEHCARGECWDLASEALKYFDQFEYVPKPVPSISRTHGHLIFEGKATGKGLGHQVGRWRGGDDRVRRGDIVEWRKVRVGMAGGAYALLGDPDHTAVIVSDSIPSTRVSDGASVKPSQVGLLEVVEQSVGKPPVRAKYDLSGLETGEMWIYRPVGMVAYVRSLHVPKCPDVVDALTV